MDDSDRRRLWVGNLDERITEFNLLKILRRYGEIAQFDFLFHKAGPNQGKPRGYCFVSYKTREEAEHAMHSLDGKLALRKKLFVKWAHSQQPGADPGSGDSESSGSIMKAEKLPSSFGGQTQASSSSNNKRNAAQQSNQAKIRAIESKLQQMERSSAGDFNVVPVYKQRTNDSTSGGKYKGKHGDSRQKPYSKR